MQAGAENCLSLTTWLIWRELKRSPKAIVVSIINDNVAMLNLIPAMQFIYELYFEEFHAIWIGMTVTADGVFYHSSDPSQTPIDQTNFDGEGYYVHNQNPY